MKAFSILTLLLVLASSPLQAQVLPPAPPTVAEAVKSCNDLAYGYQKNTVAYWETTTPPYHTDPEYFYKRMCGWQSEGGPDQAVYGLWAVPSRPWNVVTVPPPAVPPSNPPVSYDRAIESLLMGQEYLLELITQLTVRVNTLEARVLPTECKASFWGMPVSCRLVP